MGSRSADHCFCLLALGEYYCGLAAQTVVDLQRFAPGREVYIYTDQPAFFRAFSNCRAFPHRWQGIKRPYNDKRFVLRRALEDYETVICIDADTRFDREIPFDLPFTPGIEAAHKEPILEHQPEASTPRLLRVFERTAQRTGTRTDRVFWIQESLFSITRGDGKTDAFFDMWDRMCVEFQLNGLHVEGHAIGFAAEALGWELRYDAAIRELEQSHRHEFMHGQSLEYIPLARASRLRKLLNVHCLRRLAGQSVRASRHWVTYMRYRDWRFERQGGAAPARVASCRS